jgi:thioesterase domain-containing protein/acyl carrier protein
MLDEGVRASLPLPTAEAIAKLFAELFGLDQVEPDADFFQLGGDSLLSEELVTGLEQHFGVVLSGSVLIEAATPRALARILASAWNRAASPLFPVRREAEGPRLYCVHGGPGTSLFPYRIAHALPGPYSVYGLRSLGLEDGETPLTTIEAMAERYLEAMDSEAPPGRFCLLLGHCVGATIAYEMARILHDRGTAVALVMIDPEADGRAPFLRRSGLRLALRHVKIERRSHHFEQTDLRDYLAAGDRRTAVLKANEVAVTRYRPAPLSCPTLFLHCPERRVLLDPRRGYPALLSDCRFVEIDAEHHRLFKDRMEDIARLVQDFLSEQAEQQPTADPESHESLQPTFRARALPA